MGPNHVLGHTLPVQHVREHVGRVVVDKGDPLRVYIPDTDNEAEKLHPRDIVPNLSDDLVQYENCLNSLTQQESASP